MKQINRNNNHTIVKLKDSNIKVLIPDGYIRLKKKNPLEEIQTKIKNESVAFQKIVEISNNYIFVDKIKPQQLIKYSKEETIKAIRNLLKDNQGIIEVEYGYTKRGYRYIYTLVKELNNEIRGCNYHLMIQLVNEEAKEFDAVLITGDFNEINMTGTRESLCLDLARRAGLIDFSKENIFEDWSEDPYDPEYKEGVLMNLSERAGLDSLFPFHPLTQCREVLKAVINDELVIIKKEDNDAKKDEGFNENEKEFLLKLFNNEVDRITYDVEIK